MVAELEDHKKDNEIKSDKDLPLKLKEKYGKKQSNYKIDDPSEILKVKEFKDFLIVDSQNKKTSVFCAYSFCKSYLK